MSSQHKMPARIVLRRTARLLGHLVTILDYQSDQFDAQSIDEFDHQRQKAFASISAFLSDASCACGRACDEVERACNLLP